MGWECSLSGAWVALTLSESVYSPTTPNPDLPHTIYIHDHLYNQEVRVNDWKDVKVAFSRSSGR